MAFQGFLRSLMSPANSLITTGQSLQEMITQMERVDDVMSYPSDPYLEEREKGEYEKLTGAIEMKDITFGYAPLGAPLITDFSLSVKPGQKIRTRGALRLRQVDAGKADQRTVPALERQHHL